MAPTITTQTHALVIDQEVSFGTIVGGPFDFLDVFVDMSGSPNADNTLAEWRIYATNSGVVSLVATAPGGGAKPSVLNWNVGSSGAPGPYSPAKAAGTTYELRALFTNSTKSFASFAAPNPPPQIVKASLIGYNFSDTVANANAAGVGILPTNFAEVTLATLPGFAQNADISIVQDFVLPVKFTLYAVAGVGGVQAEVLQFTLDRKLDDISRILSPVRLPGATSYILTAAFDFPRVQFPPAVPVAVRASLAIYSNNAGGGPAVVNLVGNDNGPSNANRFLSLPVPLNSASVVIPEVGPVPGDGWWNVGVNTLAGPASVTLPANPTAGEVVVVTDEGGVFATPVSINGNGHNVQGVPVFTLNNAYPGIFGSVCFIFDVNPATLVGAWHIFADFATAGSAGVLAGNVNGPFGANRWTSLMLLANDSNIQVPEVGPVPGDGWWFVGIKNLSVLRTGTLPLNPTSGEVVVLTDEDGSLAAQTFNVNGNGHLVEGLAVFPMNAAYPGARGSITLQYDASLNAGEWVIFSDYAPVTGAVVLGGDVQGPAGANTIVKGIGSIIYRPGAASAGDHVATWAEVQVHITAWQGKCIIYVDDSIVSPALVPGATGVTECFGRVQLYPYAEDSTIFSVLQIEPGATLNNLANMTGMELRCNPQNATPSLGFTITPNGGALLVTNDALLSNAATATFPSLVAPVGGFAFIQLETGDLLLGAPAVPFVSVPLGASCEIVALAGSEVSNNTVAGAGNLVLVYDQSCVFDSGAATPLFPGLTGTYTANDLDGTPMMSIIYKPGAAASPLGDTVNTWAAVQLYLKTARGKCIVYIDDSIVSPALVPGATGVTQCFGRVELRPFITDSTAFTVLQIEDGATLKDLWKLTGMELRCNSQGATPSLDWSATPNGGAFYLEGFSQLSNAATATNPGIRILNARSLFISALFSQISLNAPLVPLINVAAGGRVGMLAFDCAWVANVFSGAGVVDIGYDMPTAQGFANPGTPPPQPALAGTYGLTNVDDLTISQQFLLGATDVFSGGPKFGTRLVKFTGCGNGGAGGGGSGGTALGATGNGGGGGGASLYQNFDVFVDFTHRIDIIIPANATQGAAGAVSTDGTAGQDGGTCYVLDFTANTVLCAFAGGSGGAPGAIILAGPGLGGASFPNGQRAGNLTTGSQGFLAAGGNGGSQTGPVTPGAGNFNISTFGLTPPGPAPNLYAGGAAGVNGAVGQGGGGGGGGQGPFGVGGAGGSGNAGTGTPGGDVNVGSPGSGAGGGAGGAAAQAGSRGGIGSLGQITYSYRP